jgi:hypothetical protein
MMISNCTYVYEYEPYLGREIYEAVLKLAVGDGERHLGGGEAV